MKNIVLILMSFFMVTISAYANDDEDSSGYVLIQNPNNFGQYIISIQIPDPALPATVPLGSYNISSSSKLISITATSAADTPFLGAPSKTITCTTTEASLVAQGYTKAGSAKIFTSYLTLINAFKQPSQQLYVTYNAGVCENIS